MKLDVHPFPLGRGLDLALRNMGLHLLLLLPLTEGCPLIVLLNSQTLWLQSHPHLSLQYQLPPRQ